MIRHVLAKPLLAIVHAQVTVFIPATEHTHAPVLRADSGSFSREALEEVAFQFVTERLHETIARARGNFIDDSLRGVSTTLETDHADV